MSPSALPGVVPVPKTYDEEPHLLNRSLIQEPVMVESAKGINLHLVNGRTIIDACGGAAVAILGHGNEEVQEAMLDQVRKVSYVHTQMYSTPVAEELANVVLKGSPHGLEKAFFVGSGSEAVEAAMKLARQYYFEKGEPERVHFVSRKQAYHGNTMASMSVSNNVARKIPYQGFGYANVSYVSPPYAYRYMKDGESEPQFVERLLQELEGEFLRVGPSKVIAFIAESVIGATAACVTPPKGYLPGVRALCDKYDILMILDEIMCGTGRCGTYFAFEHDNVSPDIVTVAKGLGGGYACIAGVLIHKKVIDVLRAGSNAFVHGHTYQAHPVSCAAALSVQKILRRDNLVEQVAQRGLFLEKRLRLELSACKSVGDIRGRGFFWGIEFVKDKTTKETFDPKITFGYRVQQAAFDRGVAIYPGAGTVDGRLGDHCLLAPPFTASEEELGTIVSIVKEAIESQEALHL